MLTIRETQLVELEIMSNLHNYCVKHGLKYVMAYGTLLGAVRHKGFIPWDNDMDIYMPRPDFEKFLELVKSKPIAKNIEIVYYTTDSKYHYTCIRVCDMKTTVNPPYIREQPEKMGVWVDIFPVDGVWERPWAHLLQQALLWFNRIMQRVDIYYKPWDPKTPKNILKCILHKLFPTGKNKHIRLLNYYASLCKYEEQKYVFYTIGWSGNVRVLTKDDFDHPCELQYEDKVFFAPQNCDAYLRSMYGDYMQLPPEDKRETHDIRAEWR